MKEKQLKKKIPIVKVKESKKTSVFFKPICTEGLNDPEKRVFEILECLPPHYWYGCDLTLVDLPLILKVKDAREHTWNKNENKEVDMIVARLINSDIQRNRTRVLLAVI